ncbi:MAG TPA: type II toxin-antitoxin system VapC family toxin [Epulopiscium sp.]|nr:type II toxin-antitoxin system VapC family toxin [Candidatus Epulonipiscium sp.]
MIIVDANVILRYLLQDIEELFGKAVKVIEDEDIYIPNEVMAEVVYVLEKVYKVDREDIEKTLMSLISYTNIKVDNKDLIKTALQLFSVRRLDFVDTLLFAYNKVEDYEVITFDRKLNKVIERNK